MARLCSCESGLSAERCCEAPAAALAASPAAWRLDPLLNEAQKALGEGQREKARGLLVDVLELAPGRVDALVLLARLHREAGRLKPAEALLRRAVQIDPNHVQATQDLALVLFNGGKMHEAERMARFAIRLAPAIPSRIICSAWCSPSSTGPGSAPITTNRRASSGVHAIPSSPPISPGA